MNREEHLQKTFPLKDGTTYIQNLDKHFIGEYSESIELGKPIESVEVIEEQQLEKLDKDWMELRLELLRIKLQKIHSIEDKMRIQHIQQILDKK